MTSVSERRGTAGAFGAPATLANLTRVQVRLFRAMRDVGVPTRSHVPQLVSSNWTVLPTSERQGAFLSYACPCYHDEGSYWSYGRLRTVAATCCPHLVPRAEFALVALSADGTVLRTGPFASTCAAGWEPSPRDQWAVYAAANGGGCRDYMAEAVAELVRRGMPSPLIKAAPKAAAPQPLLPQPMQQRTPAGAGRAAAVRMQAVVELGREGVVMDCQVRAQCCAAGNMFCAM